MDKRVCLASVATGQVLAEVSKHTGYVNAVAFSKCGNVFIAGGQDNISRIYILNKDDQSKKHIMYAGLFKGHFLSVTAVAISPNLKYVATGSRDNQVILYNLITGSIM